MRRRSGAALILGAGLQGCCVALALAQRGFTSLLIDASPDCMLGASLRNEGKIHLGHVYAMDRSLATGRLMLLAAHRFGLLLERFTGRSIPWDALCSRPFHYAVLRGSLLSAGELRVHYQRLQVELDRLSGELDGGGYLGGQLGRLWNPIAISPAVSPETVLAAFATPELALDTVGLRHVVKEAVSESPRVSELYGRRVLALRRDGTGYLVEGSTAEGKEWSERGDLVVNCMWCDRQTLDASVGLVPKRPRVHRLKFRVLVELPEDLAELPSLTFVLGPFGDIVNHGADRCAYLSWYPVCMRGWCGEPEPPQAWRAACRGELHAAEREKIANSTLESFDRLVPGIARSRVRSVDAGVISAFGATDIDHPASGLHQRSQIGVLRGDDGYYSIDTGKLTCAPLFAEQLAARQEPR